MRVITFHHHRMNDVILLLHVRIKLLRSGDGRMFDEHLQKCSGNNEVVTSIGTEFRPNIVAEFEYLTIGGLSADFEENTVCVFVWWQ
jgi:hypothetical protein